MEYFLLIFLSVFVGLLILAYLDFSNRFNPYPKWILSLFRKNMKSVLLFITVLVMYVLLYRGFGYSIGFFKYGLLGAILIAASFKDIETKKVPKELVIFSLITGILMVLTTMNISIMTDAFLGLLCTSIILFFISLVTKGGMGKGDIMIFSCAGIYLGLQNVLSAMLLSTFLSGVAGLAVLVFRLSNRKDFIPFIPFMFVGTMITVLYM
ncbi:MAG: A24 family peptidase [Clostridia bacterium]|nr:A24 family peptidase [Clostridia bacterium]